jgi:AraC family transcriptional regulator of adaptative response / DNA-3-methyladenine glycosylase II
MTVPGDFEHRYRAVASRDPRFDGYFFLGVTSTGIYCRPSCPARTPRREHVRFYATAAAAQAAGFRACKRCIPGAVPGSPEWDVRGDVAGRAMGLIADGVVEREGVPLVSHTRLVSRVERAQARPRHTVPRFRVWATNRRRPAAR